MPKPTRLELARAISRGLSFLAKEQEDDGSFVSFSSPSQAPFRPAKTWRTNFVPALMLSSLSALDQPAANDIRDGLAKFLMAQKNSNWSFNYWSKSAPEYSAQSYPDDLDDTFCALAALYGHDSSLIDAAAMAKIVKILLATETAVGGPYRTWLVPGDSQPVWLDVDIGVNSNVGFFLSMTGTDLPRLEEFMGKAISTDDLTSPYYPNEHVLVYYLARSYKGAEKDKLLQKTRRLQKAAKNDLDRALCLSAKLRLGDTSSITTSIDKILSGQTDDGSWAPATFYADPVNEGKSYYNGSAALTTAFVLEALAAYEKSLMITRKPTTGGVHGRSRDLKKSILSLADKQCRGIDDGLRKMTVDMLKKIAAGSNGNEIIGLADGFHGSLKLKPKESSSLVMKLGLANLYGWLAYTIYDDFVDDEGKPELISVANVSMRRSLENFSDALPESETFATFTRQVFDVIDSANAWELANCRSEVVSGKIRIGRLPDYGNFEKLAYRSLGHALPIMGILVDAGKNPKSAPSQKILKAVRHYLIARQLNDDAHDWAEDLGRGHITPVAAMVIKGLKLGRSKHDIKDLMLPARRYFWKDALPAACDLIRHHAQLSRRYLKASGLVGPDASVGLEPLLLKVEASADQALDQQRQALDFLDSYQNPE